MDLDKLNSFKNKDDEISIELGVSRRTLMKQLSAVGLIGGMAGCNSLQESSTPTEGGGGGGGNSGPGDFEFTRLPLTQPPTANDGWDLSSDQAAPDTERRMEYIVHIAGIQFWVPTIAGINDALNNLGWGGAFMGPTSQNTRTQIEMVNSRVDALEGGRDALAVPVMDPESYVDPVNNALDNDIPVIMINTDVLEWDFDFMMENFGQRIPYVGQRPFPAGHAVGTTAMEKAEDMLGYPDNEIVALPGIEIPGHPHLQFRIDGIIEVLETFDNVTVLDKLNITANISDATSRIETQYSSNPDINMIFGSFTPGVTAASNLVQNEGLEDEVMVAGWDYPETITERIQNGSVDFVVGQDPYSQGYIAPQLMWQFLERGVTPKDYITGATIVDESNVEWASQYASEFPDLIDWQSDNYDTTVSRD